MRLDIVGRVRLDAPNARCFPSWCVQTHPTELVAGHHPDGDWTLIVRAGGKQLLKQSIGSETATNGWAEIEVDLSDSAGKSVELEVVNQPSGWKWEAAYWAEIALESE